jgi:hypothetical protein
MVMAGLVGVEAVFQVLALELTCVLDHFLSDVIQRLHQTGIGGFTAPAFEHPPVAIQDWASDVWIDMGLQELLPLKQVRASLRAAQLQHSMEGHFDERIQQPIGVQLSCSFGDVGREDTSWALSLRCCFPSVGVAD